MIWVVIDVLARGIAQVVGFILIDQDLDTHDRAEGAAEADLTAIYARLGVALPAPDPARVKGPQNYVARIIVTLVTCGEWPSRSAISVPTARAAEPATPSGADTTNSSCKSPWLNLSVRIVAALDDSELGS